MRQIGFEVNVTKQRDGAPDPDTDDKFMETLNNTLAAYKIGSVDTVTFSPPNKIGATINLNTVREIDTIKILVASALRNMTPPEGWTIDITDEDEGGVKWISTEAAAAAGGRRSSSKRVRKVTRRHRKRKGSRKLRLKFF